MHCNLIRIVCILSILQSVFRLTNHTISNNSQLEGMSHTRLTVLQSLCNSLKTVPAFPAGYLSALMTGRSNRIWCRHYPIMSTQQLPSAVHIASWRHDIETLSAVMALCKGNPSVTSGLPSQRDVDTDLPCFLRCQREQAFGQTVEWLVIWHDTMPTWHHCDSWYSAVSIKHGQFSRSRWD